MNVAPSLTNPQDSYHSTVIAVNWSKTMPASIHDLPLELIDAILIEATQLNLKGIATYTYGLSQAPEPLRDVPQMLRVVRGEVLPDALRWHAADSLRQVNRAWHDWALAYAIKTIYIRRWRGSERHVELSRYVFHCISDMFAS